MVQGDKARRDEKPRGTHGLRKKATTLFSVIAVIALAVGSLFGDRGILQLLRQRERTEVLAREIETLREENRALAEEILALRRDPAAVERLAREQLGLARPGESVFVLREPPPARP
jgi:cell division protein FtsB